MIASLGMYDRAETRAANDRFWGLIRDGMRARGIAAPDGLTRGDGAYWAAWQAPDLVLSQTCGLPYRSRLHGQVTLIGTPDYGVAGCAPGYYRSVFVVRGDDPRRAVEDFAGARFAFNEGLSQSGWAAPQAHAAALGFQFRPDVESGGHVLSLRAVAEGRADIAALDAVTWALAQRWEPAAAAVRVLALTEPTPGLPFIAAAGADAAGSFAAVAEAVAGLSDADRDVLRLKGFVRIPRDSYLAVPLPPRIEQIARSD